MEKNNNTLWALGILLLGILVGFGLGNTNSRYSGRMMGNFYGEKSWDKKTMMMDHVMSMEGMMNSMTLGLRDKTGAQFDQAFLSEMIIHHEGAVAMANLVLQNSERAELINLAKEIITAQTKEINQMKEWQKNWFNQ